MLQLNEVDIQDVFVLFKKLPIPTMMMKTMFIMSNPVHRVEHHHRRNMFMLNEFQLAFVHVVLRLFTLMIMIMSGQLNITMNMSISIRMEMKWNTSTNEVELRNMSNTSTRTNEINDVHINRKSSMSTKNHHYHSDRCALEIDRNILHLLELFTTNPLDQTRISLKGFSCSFMSKFSFIILYPKEEKRNANDCLRQKHDQDMGVKLLLLVVLVMIKILGVSSSANISKGHKTSEYRQVERRRSSIMITEFFSSVANNHLILQYEKCPTKKRTSNRSNSLRCEYHSIENRYNYVLFPYMLSIQ